MPEGRLTLAAVAIALAVVFAAAARRDRRIAARRAWLAAFGACVAAATWLGAAALVLRPESGVEYFEGDHPVRLHVADADLGYAPRPGARVRALRRSERGVVFDARYAIGDDGWRITPGDPSGPPIVFFGCSFTFGQGVGDDDTLPARVSAALGGTAHVESRAATGYGPHQMLRLLETGRAEIAPGTRVLYQALGDHVRRVAGKTPWDDAGPRYVLDGDGVRFAGPLHAPLLRPLRQIAARLVKYGLLPVRAFGYDVDEDERELFVRIVAASAEHVTRAGGRFTVAFWDDGPAEAALADRLEARGIEVWRISALLPGVDRGPLMIPGDTHPGPELYRLLGAAIAARLASPAAPSTTTASRG